MKKRILKAAIIIFIVFSNQLIFSMFIHFYESKKVELPQDAYYEYAVVLGGYSAYDSERKMLNFHESVDRLIYALKLQDEGLVNQIILSGGTGSLDKPNNKEAKYTSEFFESSFKSRKIIIEEDSRNTYENALKCSHILKAYKYKEPVLLITTASHMPRAIACFKKQGILVKGYPVDFSKSSKLKWYEYFLPDIKTLDKWTIYTHEWMGYLMYKIRGFA